MYLDLDSRRDDTGTAPSATITTDGHSHLEIDAKVAALTEAGLAFVATRCGKAFDEDSPLGIEVVKSVKALAEHVCGDTSKKFTLARHDVLAAVGNLDRTIDPDSVANHIVDIMRDKLRELGSEQSATR